jgi:hypothetical protein
VGAAMSFGFRREPSPAMKARSEAYRLWHVEVKFQKEQAMLHCRCAFFRRCFGCGCGGCGGCWGCGTCWIWTPTWGWVNTCWGESTPPAKVASVASEPVAQTAKVAVKGDGNIDGTRTK